MAEKAGETVERDEPLFEISTDKVDTEIPSPAAGTLAEVLIEEGKTVGINTVVARINDGAPARRLLKLGRRNRLPHKRRHLHQQHLRLRLRLLRRMGRRSRSLPWLKRRLGRFRRWCGRWLARTISI